MKLKARVTAGIAVATLTASVSLLSAGAASATVVWEPNCDHGAGNAEIVGTNEHYCYYGLGNGYSNVYNVGSLHSGDFHAVYQSNYGPQDMPEGQIWPEPNIHTGTFTLCIC